MTITELRRADSAHRSALPDVSASRSTAHQFVLDALRDAILSGSLPAGARLIQTEKLLKEMALAAAPAPWGPVNRRFHALLTAAARSPRLEEMVHSVADLATMTEADAVRESPSLTIEADREH